MKILIADDHAVVRRVFERPLPKPFPRQPLGKRKPRKKRLRILSVKTGMWSSSISACPEKSGLDILDDLHRLRPKLPILLLSMHPEGQFARRALKSGAAGYLTKESVPEELKEAVRRVQAGGRYVSATLARNWRLTCRKDADVPVHELLSDREFQVLRLLASGKTVKQIADEISLSVKTVSTYRARILLETGMKTTAELIRYALQAGLVD